MISEKELGQALKEDRDEIEIEGNLKDQVIKIKATGKVAWAAAAIGLTLAITALIATIGTGGGGAPIGVPAGLVGMGTASAALGPAIAASAVLIGAGGGGIGALNKLRKYKIKEVSKDKAILYKK